MICNWCKEQDHALCPSLRIENQVHTSHSLVRLEADDDGKYVKVNTKRPGTGLSQEASALQRSGLCYCQHKIGANRV